MNINPILKREMIVFQRGWKLPVLIVVYNGLMILLLAGLYATMNANSQFSGGIDIGFMKGLYYFLTFGQLLLLLLMVPAVTAGSLSGERQRGTLDILLVSAKSSWEIVLGKLEAGLLAFGLLLITSLPFYAVIGVYGGVGLLEVVGNLLIFTVLALFYGALGIFWSSWFKKNQSAMIFTYVSVFMTSVLTMILTFLFAGLYDAFWHQTPGPWLGVLLYINPFSVLLTHLDVQMASTDSLMGLFKPYTPGVTLGIMVFVHLTLAAVALWAAKIGLKKRN